MASKTWYLNQINNALVWQPSQTGIATGINASTTSIFNISFERPTQYGWIDQTFTGGSQIPDNQLSGSLPSWSSSAGTSLTSGTFVRNVIGGTSEQLVVDNGIALLYPYNTVFDAGQWTLDIDIRNIRDVNPRMDLRIGARILAGGFDTTFNQWTPHSNYSSPGNVPMYSDASLTTSITEAESQLESNLSGSSVTTMNISWYCDRFEITGDELGSGDGYLMIGVYVKLDQSSRTRNNEGVEFIYGTSSSSTLTSPNVRKKIRATQ